MKKLIASKAALANSWPAGLGCSHHLHVPIQSFQLFCHSLYNPSYRPHSLHALNFVAFHNIYFDLAIVLLSSESSSERAGKDTDFILLLSIRDSFSSSRQCFSSTNSLTLSDNYRRKID